MLHVHPEARRELDAALDCYEAISDDLADAFDGAVRAAQAAITERPHAWGLASGRRARLLGVRRFVLQDFPYTLPYIVREDLILLIAIAHSSRRPGYWIARASR